MLPLACYQGADFVNSWAKSSSQVIHEIIRVQEVCSFLARGFDKLPVVVGFISRCLGSGAKLGWHAIT